MWKQRAFQMNWDVFRFELPDRWSSRRTSLFKCCSDNVKNRKWNQTFCLESSRRWSDSVKTWNRSPVHISHMWLTEHRWGRSLFRALSYLGNTHLFAGIQEVLHISPTLGHAEFGLEAQEEPELYLKNLSNLRITHPDWMSYHCRRGDMDAGNGAWANVIGQMTEHNSVHQKGAEVFRKDHFQSALYDLRREDEEWMLSWLKAPAAEQVEPPQCSCCSVLLLTSLNCSMSSSSSLSCSIFRLMVNWGSTDSRLLWLRRNTAAAATQGR